MDTIKETVLKEFPTNPEIYKWINEQGFQKEQGPQEYMMLFEIDMPKILKKFTEFLLEKADDNDKE